MDVIKLYKVVFQKNPREDIFKQPDRTVFFMLFLNVLWHSIFSVQAFLDGGYPAFPLLKVSDQFYYLIQAVVLFPVSIQLYFVLAGGIYLFFHKRYKVDYAIIFRICIFTMSSAIGLIFAIPCVILYFIMGYRMAIFVPFLCTAAFLWGMKKLDDYLAWYLDIKLGKSKLVIFLLLVFSFTLEGLIVR